MLNDNQLTELPAEIRNLTQLQSIFVYDNPLKKPPLYIASQGIEAIRNYFQSLKDQGEEFVYEAKLILIGEPGAGKTSLAKKLRKPESPLNMSEPMTRGIDILKWKFPYKENITFTTNIWDFGGQHIMHATHKYFLTRRSLYIVLADNRKEDTDFYYWLNIVELLSGNCPVLIVLNEKYEYKKFIPQDIIKSFPCIEDVFNINLANNKGLAGLTKTIQEYITGLPHVGKEPIPKIWVQIRKVLEKNKNDYITVKEYFNICGDNGIDDEKKALYISEFLHDLGVILHFQKDRLLKNRVIFNPHWATEAVYLILLDNEIIGNYGGFENHDLDRVWKQPEYKYSHAELLRLMINFELCYEIRNTQKYIIPELLDEKPPEQDYPDVFARPGKTGILHFEYRYHFMPKGIISRLIVKMNKYIYKQLQWKNGVVLTYHNSYAEIIEQFHLKKLKHRIYGDEKKLLPILIFSCTTVEKTDQTGITTIVILHTNDTHGHPLQFDFETNPAAGGIPARATLVNSIRDWNRISPSRTGVEYGRIFPRGRLQKKPYTEYSRLKIPLL